MTSDRGQVKVIGLPAFLFMDINGPQIHKKEAISVKSGVAQWETGAATLLITTLMRITAIDEKLKIGSHGGKGGWRKLGGYREAPGVTLRPAHHIRSAHTDLLPLIQITSPPHSSRNV